MNKRLTRLILIGAAIAAAAPAWAAPPPDVFKDSRGNVYIHGTTASGLDANARAMTNDPLFRRVRAGYCGEIRLSTSSTLPSIGTSWTISGMTKAQANLPIISDRNLLPRCSGNAFTPALSAEITAAGGYVDATSATLRVYLTGYTPGVSYDVGFDDVDSSISLRSNACGFYRIGNTDSNPVPGVITLNSTAYTVTSLPVADPPLCQRNSTNGSYVRYNPVSWN